MRLSELVEKYLAYTVLRPKSAQNYELVMKNFTRSVGSDKDIRQISVEDALAFRDAVLNRAKPVTFNNYRQHLVVLFNFAVENKWRTTNPFAKIKAVRVYKKPKKTVPRPLIEKVLVVLDAEGNLEEACGSGRFHPQWFWEIVVKLFFHTGMRLRQLIELKWRDIDLEHLSITLRSEGSKTYREWKIPLPALLVDDFKDIQERTIEARRTKDIYDAQVFCLPLFSRYRVQFKNDEMVEDNIHAFFKRMAKEVGQPISAHRLRHTTATIIVNERKNLKGAQILLGHADIRTTLEYVEQDLDDMRILLDSLTIVA